ncbi:MAG TPA: D-alanyl-D-alanine carboxypeptidase, partial [Gemmatimonadaceae bacterium]
MKQQVLRSTTSTLGLVALIFSVAPGRLAHASTAQPGIASEVADPIVSKKPLPRRKPAVRVRRRASNVAKPAAGPTWSSPRGVDALASAVGTALASHTRNGGWGAIIVSLTRGDTLFAQNADAMMQPASTMKMYTSAVALDKFGPDFTFHTPVLRDGAVGSDGTLAGNLYLRGVGDPSLSSRFWRDEEPMDALAKQIAAAGIKHIRGDIIGDATAFDDKLVPDGWKTSYLGASYAARVSALS